MFFTKIQFGIVVKVLNEQLGLQSFIRHENCLGDSGPVTLFHTNSTQIFLSLWKGFLFFFLFPWSIARFLSVAFLLQCSEVADKCCCCCCFLWHISPSLCNYAGYSHIVSWKREVPSLCLLFRFRESKSQFDLVKSQIG